MKTGFRSLIVWQRSMKIAAQILRITAEFPSIYRFSLAQQMQRAAISIPSNIAEGANRTSKKEYVQFLSIALGSTGELVTQCNLAVMADIATKEEMRFIMTELDEIGKMLRTMIQKLSKKSSLAPNP